MRIRVADTGVGMTPEVLAHIFEPFFTTKELGKGTGLGLATVYGIVKQSGGHISVSSSRGHGTTFLIDFPRSPDEPRIDVGGPRRGTAFRRYRNDPARGGRGDRAYAGPPGACAAGVQGARGAAPRAGLDLSRGFRKQIDLLLTDVVMPGMSGIKLAEHLLAERRSMSVVYMSGYAATSVEQRLLLDDSVPFIQKPFTPDMLARRVREVLDEAARRVANCKRLRSGGLDQGGR